MSDFARLEEKLTKLRQRARAPGEVRKLRGSGSQALLAALVTEIDETILPRRLTLSIGGTAIHLAVANRRLQALLSPAPDIEGAADLADMALPDAEAPGVAALGEVLSRAFDGDPQVEITAMRPADLFDSDVGVPANLLGRAWRVAPQEMLPAEPGDILTKFLKENGKEAIAWLRIEGESVTEQGGAETRVAALGEQAAIFLDGYFAKFEELYNGDSKACVTVIAPGRGKGTAVFFVEFGEVSAFIAADPARVGNLARRWQALVAD